MPLLTETPTRLWRIVRMSMIPMNAAILVWLLPARFVLGVDGWATVIFGVTGLLIVACALTATTLLARAVHRGPSPAPLAPWVAAVAALSQITVWVALIAFGVGWVDVDDPSTSRTDPQKSVLINLAGYSDHTLALSNRVAELSYVTALGAWGILLITLVCARRSTRRPAYHSTP
ncbi:hypothetical protein H7J77_05275 [Mycolicibacillus parakoreensis]|uniref:Uncharacterized protein n=1 Tax=Mycolicibacillus parakoreensis TaxID=1069221 RepID=A0ABY3U136_9MYCO|nr:hypothetical protein [Mycolicibacillus parakoreensis]MCV7314947.1 hypothetical protein [Mycolicibacillus parakoreensis]ULN53678.1 hypothetical protein MIU77_05010 [Mycolicibacillus parakoreensis]